jgi:Uma2 family endonuclease
MAVVIESERIPMSLEDYEELPEGPPFYDYIDGVAIRVNRPTPRHSDIQVALTWVLKQHVQTHKLGRVHHEIDVRLPSHEWVGPDIIFLSTEHNGRMNEEKGDLYGCPDLVVEISSPSTRPYDRGEKFGLYERNQVPWLWFVEQDSLFIEEYRWTTDGYLRGRSAPPGHIFKPGLFPGLDIELEQLLGSEEVPPLKEAE